MHDQLPTPNPQSSSPTGGDPVSEKTADEIRSAVS